MKTIEYRIVFQERDGNVFARLGHEVVRVQARNINSGYSKALKLALAPLGNGVVREIASVEFWQVV